MTKRKKSEVPAALPASPVTDNLDYMAQYPLQMLQTADVHVILAGCTLPVHSFVLMASSPVFSEFISLYQTESCGANVTKLPLPEVTEDALRAALQYLYAEMRPGSPEPLISDVQEAKQLAQFGHKYQVSVLVEQSDCFIEAWLMSGGFHELSVEKRKSHSKSKDGDTAVSAKPQASGVIEMASLAETYHLPGTVNTCATWLARNFSSIGMVHHELAGLSSETNLIIMQKLSTLPAQQTHIRRTNSHVVHG